MLTFGPKLNFKVEGLIFHIVLIMVATFVQSGLALDILDLPDILGNSDSSLDEMIDRCVSENEEFARTEEKYADTHNLAEDEPTLNSPPNEELVPVVHENEKRQRPFECITEQTDDNLLPALLVNPKYQKVVLQCKSKQLQPVCNPSYPYRTFDGTCNNLLSPEYGSVLNCLRRLTGPNYEGVAGFRQSVCNKPLPEPRFLSLKLHTDVDRPQQNFTHITTFFGQFLAHDFSDIPNTAINGFPVNCCSGGPKSSLHPNCMSIAIEKDDPFYSMHNVTCINFQRAALCNTCSVGKRNQSNQQTSYLDMSLIYGTSDNISSILRTNDGTGKLRSYYNGTTGELMTHLCEGGNRCGSADEPELAFVSGDRRVNMHTTLTTLHTLFHREHNRLAEELKCINPKWDEEKLFQEARKINIAQYQVIIYQEHLPVILGQNLMRRYDLCLSPGRGRTIYNPLVDATLFTEFNSAAYRLHSIINGNVANLDGQGDILRLRYTFINPEPLYQDIMTPLTKGICRWPAQNYDRFVTEDMTDFLYRRLVGNYGFDIAAVNIQRGRDNGLPTYTEIVKFLSNGMINIQNFTDLKIFMDQENIKLLEEAYCNVTDIDLWVGLINERVLENAIVGATAGELIARQFKDLKFGDRFYLEHLGNFNNEQLETLKRVTLSSLVCRNTKTKSMQLHAHIFPSEENPVRSCKNIPEIDLTCWKDYNFQGEIFPRKIFK